MSRKHILGMFFSSSNQLTGWRGGVDPGGIVVLLSKGKQVRFRHRFQCAMPSGPRTIKITVGAVSLDAELKANKTADEVYNALPIDASINSWGEEFYFKLPGVKDYRETATTQVKVGDIAFWGVGQVLAVFFGRTPMSTGDDPVPADRVNIVGRILGDARRLREVMDATRIKIEKA